MSQFGCVWLRVFLTTKFSLRGGTLLNRGWSLLLKTGLLSARLQSAPYTLHYRGREGIECRERNPATQHLSVLSIAVFILCI